MGRNPFPSPISLTFPSFIPNHWRLPWTTDPSLCDKRGEGYCKVLPRGWGEYHHLGDWGEPLSPSALHAELLSPTAINKTPTDVRNKRLARRQSPWQQSPWKALWTPTPVSTQKFRASSSQKHRRKGPDNFNAVCRNDLPVEKVELLYEVYFSVQAQGLLRA